MVRHNSTSNFTLGTRMFIVMNRLTCTTSFYYLSYWLLRYVRTPIVPFRTSTDETISNSIHHSTQQSTITIKHFTGESRITNIWLLSLHFLNAVIGAGSKSTRLIEWIKLFISGTFLLIWIFFNFDDAAWASFSYAEEVVFSGWFRKGGFGIVHGVHHEFAERFLRVLDVHGVIESFCAAFSGWAVSTTWHHVHGVL